MQRGRPGDVGGDLPDSATALAVGACALAATHVDALQARHLGLQAGVGGLALQQGAELPCHEQPGGVPGRAELFQVLCQFL